MATTESQVWTIGKLLNWTTRYLRDHGAESSRLDAEVLLAKSLNCERIALYTRFDEPASEAVRAEFRELVQKRANGTPVAYLVGHKEFFSLEFEVSPAVLIPRPDSEFVVLEFLRVARTLGTVAAIDIGTGSGNLAVACAQQVPEAHFNAIDSSFDALEVARRNARRHGVADRIEFMEGHLFEPLASELRADCIVSNPPYIPTREIEALAVGVSDHEPKLALDGGPTGLEVVQQLIRQARQHLKPTGYLILEIGAAQELEVCKLVETSGEYEVLPTIRDYSGHPRVISARLVT